MNSSIRLLVLVALLVAASPLVSASSRELKLLNINLGLGGGSSSPTPSPAPHPTPAPSTPAPTVSCPSTSFVLGLFDQWNAALRTLSPEAVADLYAPEGVLLPTLSNQVRNTRAEVIAYFQYFLANKPVGKIDDFNLRCISSDSVSLTGLYTFTFEGGRSAQARFSFVWKKFGTRWLILEQHSSAMPENYVAQVLNAFDVWNNALLTGDAAKVADTYAPDGLLLPTLSNEVANTREELIEYFRNKFLNKGPRGTILYIPGQSPNIRMLSSGIATNSGIYRFDFADGSVAIARYSFVLVKYGDEWKIFEQHSSALPEPYTLPYNG